MEIEGANFNWHISSNTLTVFGWKEQDEDGNRDYDFEYTAYLSDWVEKNRKHSIEALIENLNYHIQHAKKI